MRWTIRGISQETANAVREVADATGTTLGEVVTLCVGISLAEAQCRLEAERAKEDELYVHFRDAKSLAAEIVAILSQPHDRSS